MAFLYRTPAIVRPRQPYVEWANSFKDEGPELTLEFARRQSTIFLLPENDFTDVSEAELLSDWWDAIFEEELAAWTKEETNWPTDRTREMFDAWFDVEFAETIVDLVPDDPLTEDDIEDSDIAFAIGRCAWCGADLKPEKGRFTGFEVKSLGRFEHRIGLTLAVALAKDRAALALLPEPETEAAADGDVIFRVCSRQCEKLLRKRAVRSLREMGLSPDVHERL
jgi:hypothetical protein